MRHAVLIALLVVAVSLVRGQIVDPSTVPESSYFDEIVSGSFTEGELMDTVPLPAANPRPCYDIYVRNLSGSGGSLRVRPRKPGDTQGGNEPPVDVLEPGQVSHFVCDFTHIELENMPSGSTVLYEVAYKKLG